VLFVGRKHKLKTQAFTLIELMAVVIILGIVTTITVTSINYSIKSSKDKLYAEQIKRLEAGVASWATENSSFLPVDSNGVVFFSVSRLKDEGIVDTEVVTDPRTNEELDGCMTIKYDNTYQQYEYLYEDNDCSEVEGAYLPVISVTGGETQYAEVNGYYEFPSATSVDYNGRSITVEGPIITESGTVVTSLDFSTVGDTYLLTYESIDTTLNITATKEITLIVRDTVSPVITVTSSSIHHEAGGSFTVPEVLVSDNSCGTSGIDTSVNGCTSTLTPSINSTGFSPVIPGTYPIYYTATDSSGNIRVAVVNVVVADTLGPDLADLTFKLNNSSGAVYAGSWTKENIWVGDISAPDQGSGLREYRYYLTTSGDTCSTSYGSYTTLGNTTTDFTISSTHNGKLCFWAVDNVFNASVIKEQAILIDKVIPVCGTWTPTISPWKNSGGQSFTLSGSTDTGGSLINTAGGNCTTGASNNATCTVNISDNASNTVTCTSPVNRLETTLPTITYTNTSSSSSYYGGTVFTAITNPVSVQDTTSGLVTFRYEWTGSATNPTGINSTTCTGGTEVTVTSGTTSAVVSTTSVGRPSTSGIHYLHVCAVDEATNVNKSSSAYYLDVTVPTVSANNASSSWFSSRTTTVSASDTGGSALAEVRYSWNTNDMNALCTTDGTITANAAVLTVPTGSNRLYLCARDTVGNVGTFDSGVDQYRVDITAPVLTVNYTDGYNTTGTQSITFTATDAESGVGSVTVYRRSATLSNDTCGAYGSWSSLGTQTSPYSNNMTTANCYQYYVSAVNGAGTTGTSSTSPTAATKVDTTSSGIPTITYTDGYNTSGTQSITFSASDTQSGIASYTIYRRSATLTSGSCGAYGSWASQGTQTSPYSDTTMGSGNCYQYYVIATNGAGLTASSTTSPTAATKVDTSAPTGLALNPTSQAWTSSDVTVNFVASDAQSGVTGYRSCSTTGTSCTVGTESATSSITLSTTGEWKVCFDAKNGAGTWSSTTCSANYAYKIDKTPSTGQAISYTNGYNTSGSQSITFSATDAESGIASYTLYRRQATLSAGTCGAYGSWSSQGTQTSPYTDTTMGSGYCYQYYVSVANVVGLTSTTSTSPTAETKVDTSGPASETISYTDGYNTSGTQSITFSASDAQTGVTGYTLYRREATLTNGTCGTYGGWATQGTQTSPYTDTTMGSGYCYQYYALSTNGAGLTTTTSTSPTAATKVDTSAPISATISYTDGYNTTGTQSITFSATDAQSGIGSYTLYRRSATLSAGTCGAYGAWDAGTVRTSPYSDTMTNGNCYQYYVTAANGATLTTSTTTSPTAATKVDTGGPTLSANNGSSSWFASRTTTISATDTLSGLAEVRYSWNSNPMNAGCTSGGTITAHNAVLTVPEGSNRLYLCARDNAARTSTYDSGADQYRVDSTPPTVSANNASSSWFTSRTTTVTATDAGSGLADVRYSWNSNAMNAGCTTGGTVTAHNAVLTVPSGSNRLYLCARDNVALAGTHDSGADQYRVDSTAPTSPSITRTSSSPTNVATASFSLSAVDAESGVAQMQFSCDNTNWSTLEAYAATKSLNITNFTTGCTSTSGTKTIYVRYVNNASLTSTAASATVVYDVINPTCGTWSPTISPWKTSGTQGFTLSGSTDTGGSLINVDGGSCTTGSTNGSTCSVNISDNAGNTVSCTSPVNRVDATAPTSPSITRTSASPTDNATVSFSLSATDAESGMYQMQFSCNNTNWSTLEAYATTKSLNVTNFATGCTTTSETKTIYARFTNNAGGVSSTVSATVVYDITPSSVPTLSYTNGYNTSGTQSITFSASDTQSGIASYTLYRRQATLSAGTCGAYGSWGTLGTQTSPYSDTTMGSGYCYQYYGVATNGVGLTETSSTSPSAETKVDTSAPTGLALNPTSQAWTLSDVTVNFVASDAQSDIVGYRSCSTTGTSCTVGTESATSSITLNTTGEWKVCFDAKNGAGTWSTTTCSANYAYKIDKTGPTGQTISYTNGYNTSGSQSITFSATDAESGIASYTLYRRQATLSAGTCGAYGSWSSQGTQTSPYTDTTMGSGYCYQYYVSVTNNVGSSPVTTSTSPTAETKVDTSGPVVNISYTNGYNITGTQSITFTATDAQSGISGGITLYRKRGTLSGGTCSSYDASWTSLGTQVSPYSETTMGSGYCYIYYAAATNGAGTPGNSGTSPTNETKVDTSGPTVNASNASTSWFASRTTTISATDALSGIAEVRYSWNSNAMNGACTTGGTVTAHNAVLTVPAGSNRLYVCARDNATNPGSYDSGADQFKVDTTGPTSSANNGSSSWFTSRNVTVSATDTQSGVASLRYAWNTNTIVAGCASGGTVTTNGAILTVPAGSNRLYVCAVDNVGNGGPTYDSGADQYRVDIVDPLVSASNASSSWFTSRTTTISATDALSGIAEVRYAWNTNTMNGSCTTGGTVTAHNAVLTVPTGSNRLYVCARDNATNSNLYDSGPDQFRVDATSPTSPSITRTSSSPTNVATASFNLSAVDAESGVAQMQFSCDNTNWSTLETNAATKSLNITNFTTGCSSTLGTKTIYVRFVNGAGQTSTAANATVVYDTTPPTGVTISYTNGYNTTGTQSITFSASDTQSGISGYTLYRKRGTLSGGTCSSYDASWTSLGVQTSPYSETAMGSGYCYIYYVDAANGVQPTALTATSSTSPTDETKVDTSAPTVSASNASSSWFTSRTTTISASDALSGLAAVRYSWNTNTLLSDCTGGTATSNGAILTVPEGSNRLYVCARDNAGNPNLYDSTADQFRVDTVNPVVSASNASSSWFTSRTTTVSATDALSGIAEVRYAWNTNTLLSDCTGGTATSHNAVLTVPTGSNRLYVCARDNAGNFELYDSTADQFKVDATAPTSPSITRTSSSPTNNATASFNLSAVDAESGVAQMQFSCDNTNWSTLETNAATKSLNITNFTTGCTSTSGTKTIYVRFVNGASQTSTAASATVVYDIVNPTCGTWSPTESPWKTSGTQGFTLSESTDTGGSLINVDGGSCTTGSTNGSTCTVNISDNATNSTVCASPVNRVDATAPTSPTITRTSASPTNNATVDFSLSAVDNESGMYQMQFSCNNTNWTTLETYATTKSLNITNFATGCATTNGTRTIYARFSNNAGGVSTTASTTVYYDTVAPVCTVTGGSATWQNTTRTITGTCADTGGSGCPVASVTHDFTTDTNTTTAGPGSAGGTHTFYDNAGNTVVCAANQTVKVDKTVPTISSLTNTNATPDVYTTSSITLGWTADDGSGSGFSVTAFQFSYNSDMSNPNPSSISQPGTDGITNWVSSSVWSASRDNYVYFRITDKAGNVSAITAGQRVRIDKVGPTLTFATNANAAGWYTTTNTIPSTVATARDTLSGLVTFRYQWTTSSTNPTGITTTACTGGTAVTVSSGTLLAVSTTAATGKPSSDNATHYLHTCGIDIKGNISKNSQIYPRDTTAPTWSANNTPACAKTSMPVGCDPRYHYRLTSVANANVSGWGTLNASLAGVVVSQSTDGILLLTSNIGSYTTIAITNRTAIDKATNSTGTIATALTSATCTNTNITYCIDPY
jgi:prepilin-type N-terminal cleavage/methylation domain-containing protein